MTGQVTSIEAPGTFCHIRGQDGKTYWAHQDDFRDPATMVAGMDVDFQPKPDWQTKGKKFPPVTNVVAIQRIAA